MLLIDILKDESFKESQILAGQGALNNKVTSVMILEATDIELWGTENQLILSSYFALADLDEEGFRLFFSKMSDIGTSGLIIKPQRLINEVPNKIIDLSNQYQIPLILILPNVKYEHIVMAVLQPIINKNTAILNVYYEYHQLLSEMSLKNYSMLEALKVFKSFLHTDTQIELLGEEYFVSTRTESLNFKEESIELLERTNYVAHDYMSRTLSFDNNSSLNVLSVYVPNIDNRPYLFSIFKNPFNMTQEEYMLIENAVKYLQTHLLVEHSVKKDQFLHKNNQMLDLIFTKNHPIVEVNRILEHLQINNYNTYQGVLFSIKSTNCHHKTIMEKLTAIAKNIWPHVAFLQKNEDIIFLYNLPKDKVLSNQDFKPILEQNCVIHVSLSEPFQTDFFGSMQTLEKMNKFMNVIYSESIILDYRKLGFYKLFLEVDSIEKLRSYVPKQIIDLIEEKPELAITLETFLDQSQNFVKTGEMLYIHPKTVRYRIERISEILDLNFNDANQLLTTHVALKVCSYANINN